MNKVLTYQQLSEFLDEFSGVGGNHFLNSVKTSHEELRAKLAALEADVTELRSVVAEKDRQCEGKDNLAKRLAGEIEALRASHTWLVNLAHGIGKAGGAPEEGEWEDALADARKVGEE